MDREILFRGFHKEPNGKDIAIINGKTEHGTWLYGNLLRTDDGWYIIQNYIPPHMLSKYESDPSTVGQYTGLTDKNGVKIFEGDVVDVARGKKEIWRLRIDDIRFIPETMRGSSVEYIEIIGNIHYNPELMGGKGNG